MSDFNDDFYPNSSEYERPNLFSKNAIWIFSLFFSVLVGVILLRINLKNLGYQKKANEVLIFGVLFLIAQGIARYYLMQITAYSLEIGIIIGFIGTALLYHFYWERVIPADLEYNKRSVFIPLMICFLLFLPILLMLK